MKLMKNFLKAIGKAALYFGTYFMVQLIVMYGYGIAWMVGEVTKLTVVGEEIDELLLAEQMVTAIMDQALAITFWSGIIVLIVFWIRFAVRKKSFLKEVECKPVAVKGILPIVVFALGFNVIVSVVISYFPWPQGWMDAYATSAAPLDGSLMSWLTGVLMAPVLEEIVFRGLVYTRLKKGMPAIVAAVLSSLLFGIMHGTIIWVIYAFVLGMVMTWVFERYQSLAANILFHFVFNLMGLGLGMIPESAEFVIWILFVVSIVGCVFMFKQIVKVTERKEEVVVNTECLE